MLAIGNMSDDPIIYGDPGAELEELRILALSVAQAAYRLSPTEAPKASDTVIAPEVVAAPLVLAAGRALSLGCFAGLDTPIELLGLSVRNTFEILLRLLHVLENDGNLQAWRNEAFTDLLQIHETMLGLSGPENLKHVLKGEIERIKREALARGLSPGPRPLMMTDLVNGTGYKEEYKAFYKLYSKLVHPSSWFVNMPTSVASEMYRFALIVNAQVYGRHILNLVEERFGISSVECRRAAIEQVRKTGPTVPRADSTAPTRLPRVGRNAPCPCGSGKKYKSCHAVRLVN